MKEPKLEKVEELKLQIEELEERIAPGVFTVTPPAGPQGTVTPPVDGHALVAAGNGVVTDFVCIPPSCTNT